MRKCLLRKESRGSFCRQKKSAEEMLINKEKTSEEEVLVERSRGASAWRKKVEHVQEDWTRK